jgi:predicted nucleic acid-binding protein
LLAYLDSSAYVKLPLHEAEQEALLRELAKWNGYVSSALLGVEAIRACGRYGNEYAADARSFLADVALMPLDDAVLAEAASIAPTGLRSLDALHLATALSIREEVGAFIVYDERLAVAAEEKGFTVLQPG